MNRGAEKNMAKKSFKDSPAMSFISQDTIDRVEGKKPSTKASKKDSAKTPAGYKANPEYIELKSRRVQILVQPSVHDAVKEKAQAEGISVNEAINQALKEYVEG